ncbi:MAG: [protein-PII] uridylyltransferase [Akkermansiaceae bacterium]|nr:[protein-PII] uridylyltransferase [Verrucomicrobiales bacterium]
MLSIQEKIEANAAAKLQLPAGRMPAQELARYKTFLKVESHRLKLLHRGGGGGRQVCQARGVILDVLLKYFWNAARSSLSPQAQKEFPPLALVAIGGFGRAELNPHSDIDFMFLHDGQVVAAGKPLPHLSKLIDAILYPLWDLGMKVGHSVRSIQDCVKVANSDMQSKTSLIEARLIIGDEPLFKKFQKTLVTKCVENHVEEYIAMRLEDQSTRRAKFGNSASMQEPNIKNTCGGLRDYQNLLWMTFFKHRTRSLQDLQAQEFVSEAERKQLDAAYDFLLRVRTEMHYHTNRATDVLSKNLQPAIAHNLGYSERSPSKRIEMFMREVYTHSRNIYLITRTLEQRMKLVPKPVSRIPGLSKLTALIPGKRKKPEPAEPVDGFKFINGEIHAASTRVFRDQPRRLMRVFLYAQQRGLKIHPDLAQQIRNQLPLANREFLNDEHVRETFLEILNQRGNVAPILRAMHEVGLLGKYIPDFGRLTCLVQHEFYHQYTADEHTLMCLEQADRIWDAQASPANAYTPLLQQLERPFLLYLALLLHDTGKPGGHGKHSEVGGKISLRVARRLKLDGSATHTLRVVIEHHLLMAITSQRRDLDDPVVIQNFAKEIQNLENLSLITILTFADSLATSDKLWNGFKDALLWSLHNKAQAVLSGGTEFVRAEEKQRELLMDEVRRLLDGHLSAEELEAHFAALPPRYFHIHSARDIFDDLIIAHRFMRLQVSDEETPLAPVVSWHNEPDRGYSAVKICTWDRAGLFSKIAGSFSAVGLNILSAQIFTRSDGIVLDTFFATDAKTGNLASREQRETFEERLNQVLADGEADLPALIAKQKVTRPAYQAYTGERIPTEVRFDNESSGHRTLIEIETEDRVGLLYAISDAFSDLDLDISAAKILTEKGAAIDSFYIRELDGGKILSEARHKNIERKLRSAIHSLDTD